MPASFSISGWLLTLLFWGALFLPGYVIVRRTFFSRALCGCLTIITFSYLGTFVALSPLLVTCYWLRLPLWGFSAGVLVFVLVAACEIVWRNRASLRRFNLSTRRSRRTHRNPIGASQFLAFFGAAVLVFDLFQASIYGGYLDGDAAFHVARIRMLLDHGFNNWDPYVYPYQFSGAYHTNIYHALLATCSQILGQSYILCWSTALVWAKLVIAASHYYLARKIFQHSAAGWISVLAFTLWPFNALPVDGALRWTYLLLPHNLAPLWLFPLMIGGLMSAWRQQYWHATLLLGAVGLILCEVHMLYGAFFSCLLAPLVFWQCASQTIQKRRLAWKPLALVATLMISVPFLLISRNGNEFAAAKETNQLASRMQSGSTLPSKILYSAHMRKHVKWRDAMTLPVKEIVRKAASKVTSGRKLLMVDLDDGRRAIDLRPWWTMGSQRSILLVVILLVVCLRLRRAYPLLYFAGSAAMILYHPSVFTLFIDVAHVAPWAIARIEALLVIAAYILVPNVAALIVAKVFCVDLVRITAMGLMIAWGLQPRDAGNFEWGMIKRRTKVAGLEAQRGLIRRHIPKGEVVLADAVEAKRLIQLYDVHVIAANRMSPDLVGSTQRKAVVALLFARIGPSWNERKHILHAYRVSYVYSRSPAVMQSLGRLYHGHLDVLCAREDGFLVAKIRY